MKDADRALRKQASKLAKRNYAFLVRESEGEYEITFPDLRGCRTSGKTLEEALGNIEEAKEAWIGGTLKCGGLVPAPASNTDYSGRFIVRCGRTLHRALSETAALEGVSLNQLLVCALSEWVGSRKARRLPGRSSSLDERVAIPNRIEWPSGATTLGPKFMQGDDLPSENADQIVEVVH